MAIQLSDLVFRKSTVSAGGVDNLGGAKLATSIASQGFTNPSNVTGVTINDAFNNALGNGTLYYVNSGTYLGWLPPGAGSYTLHQITGDGVYMIGNASGYLLVDVVTASLPGADTNDTITISYNFNNLWDDILASESLAGETAYRCVYIENTNGVDPAYSVTAWFSSTPTPDSAAMQLDTVNGKNATTVSLVDEYDSTNVLSGAGLTSWSTPTSSATGLSLGQMSASDYWALWLRRTVPADTRQSNPNDIMTVAITALTTAP